MFERRNDPEIVKDAHGLLRTIQLGSISSLRCQKTRTAHPITDNACELMFRGRIGLDDCSMQRRSSISSGGARRDRTDDLMLAKHALSQLSYGPVTRRRMLQARRERHMRSIKWWAWEDLNFRPHAYQARALTN